MKPKARTFRIEWDLHAWVGAVASLGLFVIFFFGVFALFRAELAVWQLPETERVTTRCNASWERRFEVLERHVDVPMGARFRITGAPDSCRFAGWVYDPTRDVEREVVLDVRRGQALSEHSALADELYLMHFAYRVPNGLLYSGIFALALFCLVLSGLVIHVANLRRQWWQFRPKLPWRFSASDAHKVLGVFGTPFLLVFAWSGVIFGLGEHVAGAMASAAYGGDAKRVMSLYYGPEYEGEVTGPGSARLPFDVLIDKARIATGASTRVECVDGDAFGTNASAVKVTFERAGLDAERSIVLDAATGSVLATAAEETSPSSKLNHVLYDLHFGNFGGVWLRVAYALLGLASALVIVTGNVIWLERRDAARHHVGNRLLERATVGICCGANVASAAYFVANRVLADGMANRASVEFRLFLLAWALGVVCSFVPVRGPRWIGARLAFAAGVLYVLAAGFELLGPAWEAVLAVQGGEALLLSVAVVVAMSAASFALSWFMREPRDAMNTAQRRAPETRDVANV